MREFGFPKAAIRQAWLIMAALILYMIPLALAFVLYISNFDIKVSLKVTVFGIGWISILLLIQTPFINWRQRRLKVLVYEDRLIRMSGRKEQILLWEDIVKIKIVHKKSGGIANITLYQERPKMALLLGGYSDMEELAAMIKQRAPAGVQLHEKHRKIDYEKPFTAVPVFFVPTAAVMFVIASMGSKAMDILAISMVFLLGLFLLIYRPFTKFDVSYKWIEWLVAVGLLILSIYLLKCFITLGRLP